MKVENRERNPSTHTLTAAGLRHFLAERERLRAAHRDMLTQLRYSRDGQASEPLDLVADLGQLQRLESELARVEDILSRASTCASKEGGAACVGSRLTLQCNDRQLDIVLVESIEADPFKGRISIESPLGQAVAGKRLHETLEVRAGKGSRTYRIVAMS